MHDNGTMKVDLDSVHNAQNRPDVLASLTLATVEPTTGPFGNARLQTHAVKNPHSIDMTRYASAPENVLFDPLGDSHPRSPSSLVRRSLQSIGTVSPAGVPIRGLASLRANGGG